MLLIQKEEVSSDGLIEREEGVARKPVLEVEKRFMRGPEYYSGDPRSVTPRQMRLSYICAELGYCSVTC